MERTVYFVVGEIQFEWDAKKAALNLQKHKVSFEEGATVFKDTQALLLDDPDEFEDEVRFELLGYSTKRQLLVVVHVERVERLRIVSVRLSSKAERSVYEKSSKG